MRNMSENQIFQSQGLKGCAELALLGKTGPLKSSISETFKAKRGILNSAECCELLVCSPILRANEDIQKKNAFPIQLFGLKM